MRIRTHNPGAIRYKSHSGTRAPKSQLRPVGAFHAIDRPWSCAARIHTVLFLVAIAFSMGGGCDPMQAPPAGAPLPGDVVGPNAFIDISDRLGDAGRVVGWGGLAAFDSDNDGDIDLYVTNRRFTPNRLFENDGHANFTDVAEQAGLAMVDHDAVACGVGDFNNDGWLDLLVARQRLGIAPDAPFGTVMFLSNGRDGGGRVTFREVSPAENGLATEIACLAVGVGDLNNDGLLDIVLGHYDLSEISLQRPTYPTHPNELWRCTGLTGGVPHYESVTTAGIEGTLQNGQSPLTSGETFIPATFVLYLSDVDRDGFLDIFDLHEVPGGIDYFHNNGDMTFTRLQMDLLNKHGGWMGMTGGDYNGDGRIDYFATNVGADFPMPILPNRVVASHQLPDGTFFHKLLRNDGPTLSDATADTPVAPSTVLPPVNSLAGVGLQATEFGFGTTWIDTDNRGVLDLYWIGDIVQELIPGVRVDWHGIGRFLENNGDGSFTDQTAERRLFDFRADRPIAFNQNDAGHALAAVDLNEDGFRDLVVTNGTLAGTPEAPVRVFLNPAVTGNHWLTVRLAGTTSNRFGIGAHITAKVGSKTYVAEALSTTSAFTAVQPEAHFGLGDTTTVDRIEVRWPSGMMSVFENVSADQVLTIDES